MELTSGQFAQDEPNRSPPQAAENYANFLVRRSPDLPRRDEDGLDRNKNIHLKNAVSFFKS